MQGAGIVNKSGKMQTITNNGGLLGVGVGGSTEILNSSTARNAAITNNVSRGSAVDL
jgi:hypothetical protein